jgi:biotin operon repressor
MGEVTLADQVWAMLSTRYGKENAVKGHELAILLMGCRDRGAERSIQKAVETLRKRGKPIAAGDSGYFIPVTTEEKRTYLATFDARIASMCVAKSEAAAAMGIPPVEQMGLFEGRRAV